VKVVSSNNPDYPRNLALTFHGVPFDRRRYEVKLATGGFLGETKKPCKSAALVQRHEGTFLVTVDLEGLIAEALERAGQTKGGKATVVGGLITARRLTDEKVGHEVVTHYGAPQGCEWVEEAGR